MTADRDADIGNIVFSVAQGGGVMFLPMDDSLPAVEVHPICGAEYSGCKYRWKITFRLSE
jgi:hypothetical protein